MRQADRGAVPEQVLGACAAHRETQIALAEQAPAQARVHEQVVARLVIELEAPEEVLVRLRKGEALRIRVFPVEVAIARQGAIPPVREEGVTGEVGGARPAQEVEEHRLVVAEQEDAGPVLLQPDQALHHSERVRPAVDVVAQEDDAIALGQRQRLEKLLELLALPVDVSDRVEHWRRIPSSSSCRSSAVDAGRRRGSRARRHIGEHRPSRRGA